MVCAVTAEWVGGSPHPYCSVSVTNVEAQVLKWVMTNVEILNIQGSQMLRLYCICTAMYVGRPADRQQCVCVCVCHVVTGQCCLLQYHWCQAVLKPLRPKLHICPKSQALVKKTSSFSSDLRATAAPNRCVFL